MGSVKLKDLKAYVRYDGSGRVVSGSLVFRKKKPKNGRWVEIPKNLCCNDNPNSTTTTTTQGGGTPTAWVTYIAGNQENACAQTSGWNFVLYTAGSTLGAGVVLYTDATLTTEFNSYQYASILYNNGTLYQLSDLPNDGTIVSVIGACPTSLIATNYYSSQDACAGIMAVSTATVYPSNPNLSTGTTLWLDPQFTQPYQSGMAIWVTFSGHPGFAFVTQSNMGTTSISYSEPCPTTTTTTTFDPFITTTTTTTQALTLYNAGYAAYGTAQPCANQGYFNLPLTFNINDVCFGGVVTLASGTWSGYGLADTELFVNIGNGNVVQILTTGTNTALNYGCQSCG